MKSRTAVALLIETSNAYSRGLLQGIISYVREHESWSIYLPEQHRGGAPPLWLRGWKGDGIIARIENSTIADAVTATRLPIVDVSAARVVPNVPWVETNDAAIAKLAFDHLRERGFRRLGFCGEPQFNWSNWRRDHFRQLASDAGLEFHEYQSQAADGAAPSWTQESQRLAEWAISLPKPIGVMACFDIKAQQLLDACRTADVSVPEQVAVIGVDNDHLLCNLCSPRLSSIVPDAERTGYVAAQLLDEMMSGKHVEPKAYLIQPLAIETRQSTDVLAIDDPHVAAALRFIREHACENICAADLQKVVPLSRRAMETRFRRMLGRTPHEEIIRLKIERVKSLLADTSLPNAVIAERAGFAHVEYMCVAFKRATGSSPRQYREKSFSERDKATRRKRSPRRGSDGEA